MSAGEECDCSLRCPCEEPPRHRHPKPHRTQGCCCPLVTVQCPHKRAGSCSARLSAVHDIKRPSHLAPTLAASGTCSASCLRPCLGRQASRRAAATERRLPLPSRTVRRSRRRRRLPRPRRWIARDPLSAGMFSHREHVSSLGCRKPQSRHNALRPSFSPKPAQAHWRCLGPKALSINRLDVILTVKASFSLAMSFSISSTWKANAQWGRAFGLGGAAHGRSKCPVTLKCSQACRPAKPVPTVGSQLVSSRVHMPPTFLMHQLAVVPCVHVQERPPVPAPCPAHPPARLVALGAGVLQPRDEVRLHLVELLVHLEGGTGNHGWVPNSLVHGSSLQFSWHKAG